MKIFKTQTEIKDFLTQQKSEKKLIGFVPTMGALHQGHLSLVEKAKRKNDITVVSIFVNPTQFDNQDDLDKYPQTFTNDVALLESVACDVLFFPSVSEIYAEDVVHKSLILMDWNIRWKGNLEMDILMGLEPS